jgi:hypothetical protein
VDAVARDVESPTAVSGFDERPTHAAEPNDPGDDYYWDKDE